MKAVIPAAGFGTRTLPVSKVVPKELFPIDNKPAIHYIVSECVRSGIKDIVFVLSRRKMLILNYFMKDEELENFLREYGKLHLLKELEEFEGVNFDYVIQEKQLGLGHAVLCAKEKIKEDFFAVLLPDDIIFSDKPVIGEIMKNFLELNCDAFILLKKVRREDVSKYGIAEVRKVGKNFKILGVVEKPSPMDSPSQFAIVGRYVFSRKIFDFLETQDFVHGEIQLASAISDFAKNGNVYGRTIKMKWIDIGSPKNKKR